jgi:hypothetical protein
VSVRAREWGSDHPLFSCDNTPREHSSRTPVTGPSNSKHQANSEDDQLKYN